MEDSFIVSTVVCVSIGLILYYQHFASELWISCNATWYSADISAHHTKYRLTDKQATAQSNDKHLQRERVH